MREYTIYVYFLLFYLYTKHEEYILIPSCIHWRDIFLKEPNSLRMIGAHVPKLSDYSYLITKVSNWTAVIGYPRDQLLGK